MHKRMRLFACVMIIGLLTVLALWFNFRDRFLPSGNELPSFVTVPAVVDGYPELFQVAFRTASTGIAPGPDETMKFDTEFPEILGAQVGRNSEYMSLTRRVFSKEELTGNLSQVPELRRPVLNKCWHTTSDGRRIAVITYEALVPSKKGGPPVEVNVFFDQEGLERRLQGR